MGTSRPPLSFESNLDQPGVGASWTTKSAAIITGRSNAISAAGCGALGILSFSVSADCMASSSAPPIVAAASMPPSVRRLKRKCGMRGGWNGNAPGEAERGHFGLRATLAALTARKSHRSPSDPLPRHTVPVAPGGQLKAHCGKGQCWSEFLLLLTKMLNKAFPPCVGD